MMRGKRASWVPLFGAFALSLGVLAAASGDVERCPDFVINHAPIVWLHPEDKFAPSDILTHIHHTAPFLEGQPLRKEDKEEDDDDDDDEDDDDGSGQADADIPALNLDNLAILNGYGDDGADVALTSREDPLLYSDWLRGTLPDADGRTPNATACVVILVDKPDDHLDAFYFYFYSYNQGPNITQVLEPLHSMMKDRNTDSGMHFGNHVGDWEHNMVRFQNGKPTGVYYSQHSDGMAYDWEDKAMSKVDGRPVVYSAKGSHATYVASGTQIHNYVLTDYCAQGKKWDPVLSAYFYRLHSENETLTRILGPDEAPLPEDSTTTSPNATSFFYFAGRWGDLRYPDSDPRQRTAPYFRMKRFATGPLGPRYKDLLRAGLTRNRDEVSWLEWAVGKFMAVYPYLFMGWRKWVTFVVVAAVPCAVIAAALLVRRRRRSRQQNRYTKVHADDQEDEEEEYDQENIPLDDWRGGRDEGLYSSEEEQEEQEEQGQDGTRGRDERRG